jgi:hypothetical protein
MALDLGGTSKVYPVLVSKRFSYDSTYGRAKHINGPRTCKGAKR